MIQVNDVIKRANFFSRVSLARGKSLSFSVQTVVLPYTEILLFSIFDRKTVLTFTANFPYLLFVDCNYKQ